MRIIFFIKNVYPPFAFRKQHIYKLFNSKNLVTASAEYPLDEYIKEPLCPLGALDMASFYTILITLDRQALHLRNLSSY